MSNHWNLKCLDCDVVVRLWANHGESDIACMIDDASAIVAMGKLRPELEVSVKFTWGIYAEDVNSIRAGWFADHDGHKLSPISEYGDLPSDCPLWTTCKECDSNRRCRRSYGHNGSCSHKPDKENSK